MKMRLGFVSNSSSTSFCICGYNVERDEYEKFESIEKPSNYKELIGNIEIEDYSNSDCDAYYIGVDIGDMKEDETLAEFKARVKKAFDTLYAELNLGMPNIMTDGWYNG